LSKLAGILFSRQLQRRLDADGISITVIAIDPGAVNSNWAEDLPFPRLASFIGSLFLQHPDKAAYTQVIAAAAKEVKDNPEKYKGNYLIPIGQLSRPSIMAQDPELAIELWNTTEEFLASINV
jgi:NAD(P)-dependent dehydrogenase (short-subunit alcohol dehydrogenase family)